MEKPDQHLFLWGMPGSGKSYWGKRLSQYYQIPFVDLDVWLERQEEKNIAQIFEESGEDYFRKVEQHALLHVLQLLTEPAVVACGGGTPCFYNNSAIMNDSGCTIYIELPVAALLIRLKQSFYERPLLKLHTEQAVTDLLHKRQTAYRQARVVVNGINLKQSTFVKKIESCKKV